MYLSEIELRNFRNYENRQVEFSPGINVFIGENAQGKTNLLEAIYVLAMTRSHRTANDRELINWQAKEAMVKGTVIKQTGRVPLEVLLGTRGKRVKVNHLFQSRLSTYIGNLNVVLFAPEDLALVKGAPQERRQFMDTEFSQMSSRYLYAISQFRGLLKQRNEYLKQLKYGSQVDQVLLEVLSDQLAESGAAVMAMRFKLLRRLETWSAQLHEHISQQKEVLKLKYISQVMIDEKTAENEIAEQLQKLYHEHQSQEIKLGTTLYGPQRDDIRFLVNEQDVHRFGSQGQQRTTALAVKLAEIDLMNEQTGEYPLLLLDDVLSELDDDRQTHLLTAIQDKVQTFLTTTSLSGVARQLINRPTIFQIVHGTIDKEDKK
ncbi:DNA replication/repair protein RecF [Limosilactobacillus mucosae]|uniref:DNA replication/repair protein RecF n=1 Tax=Limosilactobacillus mucosae TaxID=97478 RepID=UPI000888A852|nr:DNA replication/repair protein RecF [Limosilactobacillus mucosae]SDM86998.1 DNA replication and repair protein RecF [Limosilactobacillus mucosae]SEK20033.1 DNA replication and repair protein RecF [Limosilactobacillus mucosae]SFJ83985.1 DNA replication and repair protein RecF [Limosilactobacillus mucosae]